MSQGKDLNQAGKAPPINSPNTNVIRLNEIFMLKRCERSSGVLFNVKNGAAITSRNARPIPATKALTNRGRGWRKRICPKPAIPISALEHISMYLPLKRSTQAPAGKMARPAPIVPMNSITPTKSAW